MENFKPPRRVASPSIAALFTREESVHIVQVQSTSAYRLCCALLGGWWRWLSPLSVYFVNIISSGWVAALWGITNHNSNSNELFVLYTASARVVSNVTPGHHTAQLGTRSQPGRTEGFRGNCGNGSAFVPPPPCTHRAYDPFLCRFRISLDPECLIT